MTTKRKLLSGEVIKTAVMKPRKRVRYGKIKAKLLPRLQVSAIMIS